MLRPAVEEEDRWPLPRFGDVQAYARDVDVAMGDSVDLRRRSVHRRRIYRGNPQICADPASSAKEIAVRNRLRGMLRIRLVLPLALLAILGRFPIGSRRSPTPYGRLAVQTSRFAGREKSNAKRRHRSEERRIRRSRRSGRRMRSRSRRRRLLAADDCYLRTARARVVAYPSATGCASPSATRPTPRPAATVEYGAKSGPLAWASSVAGSAAAACFASASTSPASEMAKVAAVAALHGDRPRAGSATAPASASRCSSCRSTRSSDVARHLVRGTATSRGQRLAQPAGAAVRCAGSIWCPSSDSWYATASPPASSSSRARWANSIPMTGSLRPWATKAPVPRRSSKRGCPVLHRRHEAAEGEDPGDRRTLAAQRHRVAHHRAHREAAEHRPLRSDARSPPRARRAAPPAPRGRRGRSRGPDSRPAAPGTSGSRASPSRTSGARGVTTRSRCSGSSRSASPSRSRSSVPRPWWSTSRPSGSRRRALQVSASTSAESRPTPATG